MRSPQLHYAIEQVYAEFRAPRPRAIEGCPCCTDPEHVCRLLAVPLQDVPADDLGRYGARVFLTMGDAEDFAYFLPRLLDIATTEDWWPSPQVLLGKLQLAEWHEWPKRRRAAVKAAVDAWFTQCTKADPPDGDRIDEVLCGIACAGLKITPYLEELKKHGEALSAFADIHAPILNKRGLSPGFWDERPDAAAEVLSFLKAVLAG